MIVMILTQEMSEKIVLEMWTHGQSRRVLKGWRAQYN